MLVPFLLLLSSFPSCKPSLFSPDEGRYSRLVSLREPSSSHTFYGYDNNIDIKFIASNISQTGLWIYYSGDYYRGKQVTAIIATELSYSLPHNLASLKFAGHTRSVHLPSLTLYSDTWFRGQEFNIEVGLWKKSGKKSVSFYPNFRDYTVATKSIIVTGGEWTIFELPNLEGACKCLTSSYFGYLPDPSEGTDGVYEAGVFPTFNQTGLRSVGSAVASCKKPFRDNCPKVSWTGARKSNGKVLVSKPICPVISNVAIDPCTQN